MKMIMRTALVTATAMLSFSAYGQEEWPEIALGDWDCGRGVTIRRTIQGINNHAMWQSFHLRSSDGKFSPALPRKIILTYETEGSINRGTFTERLTVNGKRCREEKKQEETR
jgi:hypothetical protein